MVAIDRASDAFWGKIAESFPDVRTGDLPPDVVHAWDVASRNAVRTWLAANYPEFR